jgi:hypothetical protein
VRLKVETVTAICATVVAVASLMLSVWSGLKQREHDRLSVRPMLSVGYNESPDVGGTYQLQNHGLGPVEVVWFEVNVDGKAQQSWTEFTKSLDIAPGAYSNFAIPGGGYYVAGRVVNVYVSKDPRTIAQLRKSLDRVAFAVCYCSLYGQRWTLRSVKTEEVDSCDPAYPNNLRMPSDF